MVQNHAAKTAAKNSQNVTGESYAQALSKVNKADKLKKVAVSDDPFWDAGDPIFDDFKPEVPFLHDETPVSSIPFSPSELLPFGEGEELKSAPMKVSNPYDYDPKDDDPYFSYRSDSDEPHEPGQWSPEY